MTAKISHEKEIVIAAHTAAGLSQTEIAQITGVSQSTVSNVTRKDEIRALIEDIRERVISECAEQAKENIREIIYSKDKEDKFLKLKYSAKVLESIGALASHTQGVIVNNIYAESNQYCLSEAAAAAMKHLSGRMIDDPFKDD